MFRDIDIDIQLLPQIPPPCLTAPLCSSPLPSAPFRSSPLLSAPLCSSPFPCAPFRHLEYDAVLNPLAFHVVPFGVTVADKYD